MIIGPGLQIRLCRRQQPVGAAYRVGGEQYRLLEERRGGVRAAARLRPAGRPLQVGGNLLVGAVGSLGPVPGPPVGVGDRIGRLHQRQVRRLPFRQRRRPVGGRPQQRMPEPHPGADLRQPGIHRRRRRLEGDPQLPGRPPYQVRVTRRVGRRELQQPLSLLRQLRQLPGEALFDPGRYRHRARQAEPAGQLRPRQPAQQLEQRQRIPAGFPHDLIPYSCIERPGQRRLEQHPGVCRWQPVQEQFGNGCQFRSRGASAEHQPDRVGRQTPRREAKRLRRRLVQPVLVVHHAQQWLFLGGLRQQAEYGQSHQEPVRDRSLAQPERHA